MIPRLHFMQRDLIFREYIPLNSTSHTAMFYGKPTIYVEKEVLMYDFNAIISAVGGSLGLFLGFSCYGVVDKTLQWTKRRFGGSD